MNKPLHVLLVEDSEDDAALVLRELRRAYDVSFERVESAGAMTEALERRRWDLVLSDFSMPAFDAPAALALLKATGLDIPVMVISGTIGEEAAVNALKAGADDFLVKGRLARLLPAIERELREFEVRKARREAERALRESETRLRRVIESAIIGVIVTREDGTFTQANDAFLRLVGYSRDELLSGEVRLATLMPPEWQAPDRRADDAGDLALIEKEFLRKDGGRVPVLVGGTMLEHDECVRYVADLTERKLAEAALKRSEEQLRQSQKMEAIGNLAGGIAHDFNNLLSVILSYSGMLAADLGPDDPRCADLEEISAAGQRAEELTRQLLAFSRQQILQPRICDLNHIVVGVNKMLRRLIGADVELATVTEPHLGMVRVDPGQIEQIIMNLVVNARDALPRGGKVTIETANVDLDQSYASAHVGVSPGPHVMLAISDTGVGMDRATQDRMFEPFFTTKEKGKGTGLGLATVFGIVQQSAGSIRADSEPGRGTTFRTYFPRLDAGTAPQHSESIAPLVASLRGSETILLVEDEESVRVLARTILRRHGYHVLEAQSGGDALIISEQHAATIDLMITDVVMPRMTGHELALRLHPLRPEMKVLYMSGYTDNSVIRHGVLASGIDFLQKPITPLTFTRKVREVLDGNASAPGQSSER